MIKRCAAWIISIISVLTMFGCGSHTESDYPAAIMVEGTVYLKTITAMPAEIDESAIIGYTTSYTDTYPKKNGETNFNRELNMPYAKVEGGIVVLCENEWYLCMPEDGESGSDSSNNINYMTQPEGAELPTDSESIVDAPFVSPVVKTEEQQKDVSTETPAQEPALDEFVLVEAWLPNVRTELRYATENNFTGQIIYNFSEAWLRYGTVQKLAKAQEKLTEMGYSLLIWDAFRPVEAQWKLWEVFPDPVYVANPQNGFSSHSRGNTVDVTLVTLDGEAVEMPTEFDDFSLLADRDYSDVSEEAAQNAILLETIMTECGFKPYSGEWWHFSDVDTYPVEESFVPG